MKLMRSKSAGSYTTSYFLTGVAIILLGINETSAQQYGNQVKYRDEGGYRHITSNGLPDHETGAFPNRNNPNRISAQSHSYKITLSPTPAGQTTALGLWPFGVAVNGIPIDPGAAEFWNRDFNSGWQYEALGGGVNLGVDGSNAHVQPTGAYHYHGLPNALIKKQGDTTSPTLIGYAADGFPIYNQYCYENAKDFHSNSVKTYASYTLKPGQRNGGPGGRHTGEFVQDYVYSTGLGTLDECNGHSGVTADYPAGTYHYHLTETFPYIPRQFRGTPDASFMRHGPGGGGPGGQHPRRGQGEQQRGGRPLHQPPPGHRPPPHHRQQL